MYATARNCRSAGWPKPPGAFVWFSLRENLGLKSIYSPVGVGAASDEFVAGEEVIVPGARVLTSAVQKMP